MIYCDTYCSKAKLGVVAANGIYLFMTSPHGWVEAEVEFGQHHPTSNGNKIAKSRYTYHAQEWSERPHKELDTFYGIY